MNTFKAIRINAQQGKYSAGLENVSLEMLTPGEVVIKGSYSSINYKDALAITGKGRILRKSPLVGGIDVAGVVEHSDAAEFKAGDEVLVCGCGLSETLDGGYAEYSRVPAKCVVLLPQDLSLFEAMAIGSAGFTAALAIERMEHNAQTPELGPIVVTGATGGVGSFAVDLFANRGYEVVAISGKPEYRDYLTALGASRFLPRQSLNLGRQALETAEWGGAVDNVGGDLLSWLTRSVKLRGNIACIGLAGGVEINTTVMPFILRGISLLGINSVYCPADLRARIWQRLADDLRPRHIDKIVTREIALDEVFDAVDGYVKGQIHGRIVVRLTG